MHDIRCVLCEEQISFRHQAKKICHTHEHEVLVDPVLSRLLVRQHAEELVRHYQAGAWQ